MKRSIRRPLPCLVLSGWQFSRTANLLTRDRIVDDREKRGARPRAPPVKPVLFRSYFFFVAFFTVFFAAAFFFAGIDITSSCGSQREPREIGRAHV